MPYTSEGDHFGTSVSVCGDTIAIGARNEDSNRTEDSGAAYVFERSGTVWAEAAYLKAPNPDVGDRFGQSVATCEDLVVGRFDLIALASVLRIPVHMHNVPEERVFRPTAWNAFGTAGLEGADFRACAAFGPLYK